MIEKNKISDALGLSKEYQIILEEIPTHLRSIIRTYASNAQRKLSRIVLCCKCDNCCMPIPPTKNDLEYPKICIFNKSSLCQSYNDKMTECQTIFNNLSILDWININTYLFIRCQKMKPFPLSCEYDVESELEKYLHDRKDIIIENITKLDKKQYDKMKLKSPPITHSM